MTSIYGCSLVFWDQVLLNRLAQQRDESLSGCMSEVRVGHSDLVWACGLKFVVVEIQSIFRFIGCEGKAGESRLAKTAALWYRCTSLSGL